MTFSEADIAAAAERAREWLLSVHADAIQASEPSMTLLLHVTLGLWLCDTASGIGDARPALGEIAARLGRTERKGGLNLTGADSHLLLYCAAILKGMGESHPTLDAYVARSAEALAEHTDGSALEASEL